MVQAGLVLEGGGMRGLYTAGVLEYFLERDLYFPYNIGVSAGACMAASYLSRQKGRNQKVNLDFVEDRRYISFSNFIRKREVFGMDFIFDEIPNRLVPYDLDTYKKSPEEFIVVATDCETGEPVYFDKTNHGDDIVTLLRASSSLPFVASSVVYKGRELLDGGISDPIPIRKAQEDGYEKNVIIMTKPPGYYKRPPGRLSKLMKYRRHPKINDLLAVRYKHYNETLRYIEEQERQGKVFVLRPSKTLPVGRMERKRERLEELYRLGWKDAEENYEAILRFLE